MRAAPNTTRVVGLVTTSPAEAAAAWADRATTQTRINNEITTVCLMRDSFSATNDPQSWSVSERTHGACQRPLSPRFFIILPYIARSHSIPEMQFFAQF